MFENKSILSFYNATYQGIILLKIDENRCKQTVASLP